MPRPHDHSRGLKTKEADRNGLSSIERTCQSLDSVKGNGRTKLAKGRCQKAHAVGGLKTVPDLTPCEKKEDTMCHVNCVNPSMVEPDLEAGENEVMLRRGNVNWTKWQQSKEGDGTVWPHPSPFLHTPL